MGRMTKSLSFSVPLLVAREVEQVAKEEQRTKSELFCQMVRVYRCYRRQKNPDEDHWVVNLITEAKAEQRKAPMHPRELIRELMDLGREVATEAKKRGINRKDVNRIISESRKR